MSAPKSDREGVILTAAALQRAGWALSSVYDGEESVSVATPEEAADVIMTVDMAHLHVTKDEYTGWVFFVLGNDPEEVINDNTLSGGLDDVINALTDKWFE